MRTAAVAAQAVRLYFVSSLVACPADVAACSSAVVSAKFVDSAPDLAARFVPCVQTVVAVVVPAVDFVGVAVVAAEVDSVGVAVAVAAFEAVGPAASGLAATGLVADVAAVLAAASALAEAVNDVPNQMAVGTRVTEALAVQLLAVQLLAVQLLAAEAPAVALAEVAAAVSSVGGFAVASAAGESAFAAAVVSAERTEAAAEPAAALAVAVATQPHHPCSWSLDFLQGRFGKASDSVFPAEPKTSGMAASSWPQATSRPCPADQRLLFWWA